MGAYDSAGCFEFPRRVEDKVTGSEVIRRAENIQGWMGRDELEWLYAQASEMDSVVEVGSWRGHSSYVLLSACKGPVFCVDHFQGSPSEINDAHRDARTTDIYSEFIANCGRFENLRLMRMYSSAAASIIPDNSIDMVFIDAEHTTTAVLKDLALWRPKAKKLFCGHDRLMNGVAEALSNSGVNFKEGPGSLWYVEIK